MSELQGLHDDVYRRPLATALVAAGPRQRLALRRCRGRGGDVTVALARIVGRDGRVYAVDSDPAARRGRGAAAAAAAQAQVIALTQAGEDLDAARTGGSGFCRFVLLHVPRPGAVLRRMAAAVRPGGWVVAQEPITSAGRIDGAALLLP